jgi:phage N-6-adenine-methyltransferase
VPYTPILLFSLTELILSYGHVSCEARLTVNLPASTPGDPKRSKRLVYHRSTTALWETPQALFDALHAEFGFTLDVCALATNAKSDRFFTPDQDGLLQDWGQEVCWCNAPYGLILRQWVQKAYEASKAGATVVMLLPVRSDTVWWHDYVQPSGEIRYLKGRLKFPHSIAFRGKVLSPSRLS